MSAEPLVTRHFVTFYSPGTFVYEETTKPIESWNVERAVEMSKAIVERYGSRPAFFVFSTRTRGPDDLDSSESKRSARYFLGGKVETRAQVEARATEQDRILVNNLRINRIERVVTTETPWRSTNELNEGDIVLEAGDE